MHNQPKYKPLRPIDDIGTISDGRSARPQVEGTVARGSLDDDPYLIAGRPIGGAGQQQVNQQDVAAQGSSNIGGQGMADGAQPAQPQPVQGQQGQSQTGQAQTGQAQTGQGFSNTFPFPITPEVMDRGEERYNIYCAVCHSRTGDGRGMVVRRGYRQPPSFHEDRLRQAPAGYFFDVITNGFGAMPDYSASINPRDRWAIVAYLRALQLSQRATINDVPPEERSKLNPVTTPQGGNQR